MTTPTQRIIIHQTGGPEVMQFEDATLPNPGPDEIVVEHAAIGLNYIDVYFAMAFIRHPTACRSRLAMKGRARLSP